MRQLAQASADIGGAFVAVIPGSLVSTFSLGVLALLQLAEEICGQ